jgi:3-oxoacyl-[acyl-carrier-protein] synthase II
VNRRVVITGAGVVTSIGVGREGFWSALAAGVRGAHRVEFDRVGEVTVCAVPNDEVDGGFGKRELRRTDRAARLAILAALQACEDAGNPGIDPERTGAAIANVHGGAGTLQEAYADFFERDADRVSPFTVPLGLSNSPVAAVARTLGLRGPCSAPATACAAGNDALGQATMLIRSGRADAMLAGGAEAPLSPLIVAAYRNLGALSKSSRPPEEASRPFDRGRDGFVIGEGSGVLFLEERDNALARGARILAEIVGYAATCDAGHLTDPDPAGQAASEAIRLALADARRDGSDVGYVNAHATSTPAGDLAEARALVTAGLAGVPVSATKAMHGHTLGAAGAIEAVAALLPLVDGVLPATANLDDPEPEPKLNHVLEARSAEVSTVVSTSFGFGGHNAVVVLARA